MATRLTKIEKFRKIVTEKQYAKIEGCTVDLFSASHVIAVYDQLSEENKAKYVTFGVATMIKFAYDMFSKARASA